MVECIREITTSIFMLLNTQQGALACWEISCMAKAGKFSHCIHFNIFISPEH